MARLLEHQAKQILAGAGILVPRGRLASSVEDAINLAEELACPVVLKAQVFVTSRASKGLIKFPRNLKEVRLFAEELFGKTVGGFAVEKVLVEEVLEVERELFAACLISDEHASPMAMLAGRGGSGIEEIAKEEGSSLSTCLFDPESGLKPYQARALANKVGFNGELLVSVAEVMVKLAKVFLKVEARSLEVNPLAVQNGGKLVALDCHLSVDDSAVFRHPELGIEIAREIGHPPTALEKISARVEAQDHRGTFFFLELPAKGERLVGFHGAGGGGSMMSMDALNREGFTAKNFCDTSGNPSAAKVYRAAKHILAQEGIIGYFASGSGVASQEQFHSARGLVKAFREWPLTVPAVIRLGGNKEEVAIDILKRFLADLPVPVEAYGKDDSAEFCAQRLKALVEKHPPIKPYDIAPTHRTSPPLKEYRFTTLTGTISFDHAVCADCLEKPCVSACVSEVLEVRDGFPKLKEPENEWARRCSECLACELSCFEIGKRAVRIDLPIEGFDEYLSTRMRGK